MRLPSFCAYHVTRVDDPDDTEFPEFEAQPYQVFPVEILALLRARRMLGQDLPVVDHPLIAANPLAEVPAVIEGSADPLLTTLATRVRQAYPDIEDWTGARA